MDCPNCEGKGSYEYRSDSGIQYPAVCSMCGGSGKLPGTRRGHIYVDFFIDCATCGNEEPVVAGGQSRQLAVKEARRMGYINTRRYGYVCPSCQKRMRKTA